MQLFPIYTIVQVFPKPKPFFGLRVVTIFHTWEKTESKGGDKTVFTDRIPGGRSEENVTEETGEVRLLIDKH